MRGGAKIIIFYISLRGMIRYFEHLRYSRRMNQSLNKIFTLVALIAIGLCSCNSEENDAVYNQQTKIKAHLTSNEFEYTVQGGVYKYVAGNKLEGEQPVVEKGDIVTFNFEGHIFPNTAPATSFFTNKPNLADALAAKGYDTSQWDLTPFVAKAGNGDVLKGIDVALPKCQKGDSVLLYITSDLGFGKNDIPQVSKNTALIYIITIEDVQKQ